MHKYLKISGLVLDFDTRFPQFVAERCAKYLIEPQEIDPGERILPLSVSEEQITLADVEKGFADGWSSFGIKGNIGHHEKNLWFNVKIPIGSLDLLKDAAFSARLKDALGRTVCPFAKLKPFCTAG